MQDNPISVSECIALVNQTLEYAFPVLLVEGEVASFKVNKQRYVFFDIKDDESTLGCFMTVYQLRVPIEDGMRIQVLASPRLTPWGKFSLTIREIRPVGEGSIKRSFELLRAKLARDGLFDEARKRPLPGLPQRIGLITSTEAAGYIDFVTILNNRWGGMEVSVANVQVQGMNAPQQIIRAIDYFNQTAQPPEVLVIVRGGGSADDLAAFNDEPLVRAIAGSRIPTMVGVGHEVDITLADLVADVRAATPSNAAQLLVSDRRELQAQVNHLVQRMLHRMERRLRYSQQLLEGFELRMLQRLERASREVSRYLAQLSTVLKQLSPQAALSRGYALLKNPDGILLRGAQVLALKPGDEVTIETHAAIINAGVQNVSEKD